MVIPDDPPRHGADEHLRVRHPRLWAPVTQLEQALDQRDFFQTTAGLRESYDDLVLLIRSNCCGEQA